MGLIVHTPVPILNYYSPRNEAPARSWVAVVGYVIGGLIIPFPALFFAAVLTPRGQQVPETKLPALLFHPSIGWAFYLLAAYSMTCLALLVINPRRFQYLLPVRLGIYTAVLLDVQYLLCALGALLSDVWFLPFEAGVAFLAVLLMFALFRATERTRRLKGNLLAVIVLVGSLIGLMSAGLLLAMTSIWIAALTSSLLLAILMLGPLMANLAMTRYLLRLGPASWVEQSRSRRFLAPLTWLSAYTAACAVAITRGVDYFAALPVQPSGICYVASAAAKGHRHIVGSRPVRISANEVASINWQLRYLLCAEIALHVVSPSTHRLFRQLYNRYGPLLAAALIHPLLADLAYLSLKPLEWGARLFLRLFVSHPTTLAARIYREKAEF